jgi:hypothetical protein
VIVGSLAVNGRVTAGFLASRCAPKARLQMQ